MTALDNNGWTIPGTITDKDKDMYRVEYDCGGYDNYAHAGDQDGIGKVLVLHGLSFGKNNSKSYYEDCPKTIIFGKGVYLYD